MLIVYAFLIVAGFQAATPPAPSALVEQATVTESGLPVQVTALGLKKVRAGEEIVWETPRKASKICTDGANRVWSCN
jgi:hypothetical protein